MTSGRALTAIIIISLKPWPWTTVLFEGQLCYFVLPLTSQPHLLQIPQLHHSNINPLPGSANQPSNFPWRGHLTCQLGSSWLNQIRGCLHEQFELQMGGEGNKTLGKKLCRQFGEMRVAPLKQQ